MIRRIMHGNAIAPQPLLVLAALCLAAAVASAQQKAVPGAAFGGGAGDQGASSANQPSPPDSAANTAPVAGGGRGMVEWLAFLRQAARAPAYTGTYVVWSMPGTLASSRIWHASNDDADVERVDALSGEPRSTYRVTNWRGNAVETFLYAPHVLRIDRRDAPGGGGFPDLPNAGQGVSPADFYNARQSGQERVAGFMADIVQFVPRDGLRYGYRVWSEQRTGMAIRLQTLDDHGRVLEQAAFSDLTLDAPVNARALLHEMHRRHGWRVERVAHAPTTAAAEGWRIGGSAGQPAPGFALQHCYRQPVLVRVADVPAGNAPVGDPAQGASGDSAAMAQQEPVEQGTAAASPRWFQCVFSDGLAAVSVFIEPYNAAQHAGDHGDEQEAALGATHLLARRVGDAAWVTVMGEVPPRTLKRFAAEVSPLP